MELWSLTQRFAGAICGWDESVREESPEWLKRTVDSYAIPLPTEVDRAPLKRQKKPASRKSKGRIPTA